VIGLDDKETTMPETLFLHRPEGRIAYDDAGSGPLVVCLPGLGDLRSEYRHLAPLLVEAGYRVVTVDLRGHGSSDATFSDHRRPTVGDDVVALLEHLDAGPAHLVGTSFGAAAVVWAAAQAPERVASVALIGPFVRDVPIPAIKRAALRAMLARPWGVAGWLGWYRKLWGSAPPPDQAAHTAAIRANLAEPGRLAAVRDMALSTCEQIDPRLDELTVPSLVVMGTADPDFDDPAEEARIIAGRTGGGTTLVDGAGHYPHAEQPEVVGAAMTAFLATARTEA
jgi:pimeloyl-ACP methyl ester carboxylesterase